MATMPVKRLDLEVMTDRELVQELARMCENCLDRLNTYLEMGTGQESENDAIPEALDGGVVLASKLDQIATDFLFGPGGRKEGLCGGWNWGVQTFQRKLQTSCAEETIAGAVDA